MIQRIQSVYLLVGAAIQFLFAFGTYFTYNSYTLTGCGLYDSAMNQIDGNSKTFILACALGGGALVAIFLFKKRKLQMRLANMCALLVIAEIAALVMFYLDLEDAEKEALSIGYVVFLLPVSMVAFFLAKKGIKKDDDLVRSVDRIR